MSRKSVLYIIFVVIFLTSCSAHRGGSLVERIRSGYYPYKVQKHVEPGYAQYGIASWYGRNFHGKRTANGEIYNMYAKTAAHKTLPFGTYVEVINLNNHRRTVVRINDRGPFVGDRIIDLSYAAAKDLEMIGSGTARVKLVVLSNRQLGYSKTDIDSADGMNNSDLEDYSNDMLYAVQIGSFASLSNAINFKNRAIKHVSNVYIKKVVLQGRVLYRVMVGKFNSKQTAIEFAYKNIVPVFGSFCINSK